MRLREYLEIQNGLKSKLKEDYDDEDEDYTELEDLIDFDLASVGFIRNEYEDDSYYRLAAYSVDGADRVLVSVCAPDPDDDENIYNIYATIKGDLQAVDATKLPHASAVVNPHVSIIPADQMTQKDWQEFYDDCVAYQKEYEAAESKNRSTN